MTTFVRVGEPVPELTLPDLDGARRSLTASGQRLLIFMWASW